MSKETELQLVSFELAKRLKSVGFDWKGQDYANRYFNTEGKVYWALHPTQIESHPDFDYCCEAPTLDLAQKWFRDVHKILLVISTLIEESDDDSGDIGCLICEGYLLNHEEENKIFDGLYTLKNDTNYHTIFEYEEVQEAGLTQACKYLISQLKAELK